MIKTIHHLKQRILGIATNDTLMLRYQNHTWQVSASGIFNAILWVSTFASSTIAEEPTTETSMWVTSIATVGQSGQFVASTANSLLLREATVVSFSGDAPQQLTTLYSHPAAVWCVAATSDGSLIASADYRGNLVTYDMQSKKASTHDAALERWCQAIVWSPDDRFVVAGNETGKVMAWEIQSSKVALSVELDGHAVTDLAFSPDGKQLAASDGHGHVHLLQWPSLDAIGKIEVSDQPAWAVAYIEQGNDLLVGSGDRNLYRCVAKPDAKPQSIATGTDWITQIAVSPSGQVAASEVGGRVVFPIETGAESIDAKSGVWSLQWNGESQLLVGTRKHGIAVAGRSWKWAEQTVKSEKTVEAERAVVESKDE